MFNVEISWNFDSGVRKKFSVLLDFKWNFFQYLWFRSL